MAAEDVQFTGYDQQRTPEGPQRIFQGIVMVENAKMECLPPAERGVSHFQNHIGRRLDLRSGSLFQGDLERSFEDNSLHGGGNGFGCE